jgi:anti-anti-sigma factor
VSVVTRLALEGEVDHDNAADVLAMLLAECQPLEGSVIEIDCSGLTFIDSSGMAMLIKLRTRTERKLVLIDLPTNTRIPFVTRLDDFFEVRRSRRRPLSTPETGTPSP